jgi:hypothetical protein
MEDLRVPQPKWVIEYAGKDISRDIAPYVLDITYTDVLEGESDDLQINLEDRDHRWKNGWFPQKGDVIKLSIGYAGEKLVNCGSFQVDEVELNGPPDTVSLRALAAGVTESLRTRNTVAFENQSLGDIASKVAAKHNLKLVGSISEEKRTHTARRVTQRHETDLAFLKRIGKAEGVVFTVKGSQLVWHDLDLLDGAADLKTLRRTDLKHFTFRSKTNQVYKACTVSYHDPKTKKLITHTEPAKGVTTGDTLKLIERCESKADAIRKAKAGLRGSNGKQVEGSVTIVGSPRLAAGGNITIKDLGVFDGQYQILKARHNVTRDGGYSTDLDLSTTMAHNKELTNLKNLKKVTTTVK